MDIGKNLVSTIGKKLWNNFEWGIYNTIAPYGNGCWCSRMELEVQITVETQLEIRDKIMSHEETKI